MAEGLALAASVIAVLQVTGKVISICYDYSATVEDSTWELPQIKGGLESLRSVLQLLEPRVKQVDLAQAIPHSETSLLLLLREPLQKCLEMVERLEIKLKTPGWAERCGPRRKAMVQALRWPLKEGDAKKTLANIDRFKATFHLAITADQQKLLSAIENLTFSTNEAVAESQEDINAVKLATFTAQRDLKDTKETTLDIQARFQETRSDIWRKQYYRWLNAPDPSTDQNRARKGRQAGTGLWFVQGETFIRWKDGNGSGGDTLIWLHGKPGCGKTVLSSTIVHELSNDPGQRAKVVYFYFSFNDAQKQTPESMIRSLILQLFEQNAETAELKSCYSACNDGMQQPDIEGLLKILKNMTNSSDQKYIILDALDECSDIHELLGRVEEIQGWRQSNLKLLLTSRRHKDIEDRMQIFTQLEQRICIQSALVDVDISRYVHGRLQTDFLLQRWRNSPQIQEEIRTTLANKADGMFRWAVCQLDSLQRCLNLTALRKSLSSLPKTLDDTYARILGDIPEEFSDYAIRILQWLTHSVAPLSLNEVADVLATNIDGDPWFDECARFPDPCDILLICSSLVTTESAAKEGSKSSSLVMRLAHFSVKEYLVSDRIQNHSSAKYAMRFQRANDSIGAVCLSYLLQFVSKYITSAILEGKHPLAKYATLNWITHAKLSDSECGEIAPLSLRLLQIDQQAYRNWLRLYDMFDQHEQHRYFRFSYIAPPLYMMSHAGVVHLVYQLLNRGPDSGVGNREWLGFALVGASQQGHYNIVQLLLARGAEPDAIITSSQRRDYAAALQAASGLGHEAMVRLLINHGADVNLQIPESDRGRTALEAAACNGHIETMRVLIDANAVPDCSPGSGGALLAAWKFGSLEIVELLLRNGANVRQAIDESVGQDWPGKGPILERLKYELAHLEARPYRTRYLGDELEVNPLEWASYVGDPIRVRDLIAKGANARAEFSSSYRTALIASACSVWFFEFAVETATVLIESGADVNMVSEVHGTALQAASRCPRSGLPKAAWNRRQEFMELLVARGADVNALGTSRQSAVTVVSGQWDYNVVKLLLENGADPNLGNGKFPWNALDAAMGPGQLRVFFQAGSSLEMDRMRGIIVELLEMHGAVLYQEKFIS